MKIVLIVVVGSFLLIGLVAYLLISKLKKDAWEGELIDKQLVEMSSGGDYDTTNYVLVVKTAGGAKKRSYVSKKLFDQFSVGERLVKRKGETYPKKAI